MIDKFKELIEGTFNNRKQAFSYPSQYAQITIIHKLLDNGMIYGEQAYTVRNQAPYRQFVLKVIQEEDTLRVINHKLKDPSKFLGFQNLDELTEDQIEVNPGCDNIFVEKDGIFYGKIEGCDCYVNWNGQDTYLFTECELSDTYYYVIDKGLSKETGKRVWGSEYGMFKFDRL